MNLLTNFFKNYISTLSLIGAGVFYYSHNERFINFSSGNLSLQFFPQFSLPSIYIFYMIIIAYAIFLIPFYSYYGSMTSKARLVFWLLWKAMQGKSWNTEEYIALRAWIVKLFFLPLMIVWLGQHIFNLINNTYSGLQNISLLSTDFLLFFNTHFFWIAFNAILFFDVFFFTLSYLLEAPFLKNTIKSVEPTLIGWAVALLCYPPFNSYIGNIVNWYSTDFPQFWNMYVHLFFNTCILILMGIYAWASVALGWKASNLTNRGIVMKGPYKYVRHPAYICKNTAWFIGTFPILFASFQGGNVAFHSVLIASGTWAFLYYMRAMTEEAHLSADPDYLIYKNKVRYKFIPKVW